MWDGAVVGVTETIKGDLVRQAADAALAGWHVAHTTPTLTEPDE